MGVEYLKEDEVDLSKLERVEAPAENICEGCVFSERNIKQCLALYVDKIKCVEKIDGVAKNYIYIEKERKENEE